MESDFEEASLHSKRRKLDALQEQTAAPTLSSIRNKALFKKAKECNFDGVAAIIRELGGKLASVNQCRSLTDKCRPYLWMAAIWKNNAITAAQKIKFVQKLEEEFEPDFNLKNGLDGNIVHDLCGDVGCVDQNTSKSLLSYLGKESKCISKNAFVAVDKNQQTPLHHAVENSKTECVHLLLPYYTDQNIKEWKDKDGQSILDLSAPNPQMQQLLLAREGGEAENMSGNAGTSTEFREWVESTLGYPQYYQLFVDAGYEHLEDFDEDIDDGVLLKEIGIQKRPHRKTILTAIQSLLAARVQSTTKQCNGDGTKLPEASNADRDQPQKQEPATTQPQKVRTGLVKEEKDAEFDGDADQEQDEKDTARILEQLVDLGNKVGSLSEKKKKLCRNAFIEILEMAKSENHVTPKLEGYLNSLPKPNAKFIQCVSSFLALMGYRAMHSNGFTLKGVVSMDRVNDINQNFYHLTNAMQKPKQDIYQQLCINIDSSSTTGVMKHESGIYDAEYIIFSLPQIVLESQQSSLVEKVTLNPAHLERFINFLVPDASKHLCREIYFERLLKLKVSPIGVFGSRQEVLSTLMKYDAISTTLHEALIKDEANTVLNPGIHAILPIALQHDNKINTKWDHVIYLFYWSLPNSFDMVKMKGVKNMRKDPTCLLSRVLYQISSTVAIQVSAGELQDFGVIKQETQDSKKPGRRRVAKVKIEIEETKENHIMCTKHTTLGRNIDLTNASDMFLLNAGDLSAFCRLYPQKEKKVQVSTKWSGSTKQDLIDKLKELNQKYVVQYDKDFTDDGIDVLADALCPTKLAEYQHETKKLESEEKDELEKYKIKSEVDKRLEERNQQILQQFFNEYHSVQYCRKNHQSILEILQELGEQIRPEIVMDAKRYSTMLVAKTPLPEIGQCKWYHVQQSMETIQRKMDTLMRRHKNTTRQIAKDKEMSVSKAQSLVPNAQREASALEKREKKKRQKAEQGGILHSLKKAGEAAAEAIGLKDEEKILSEEEIQTRKTEMISKAKVQEKQKTHNATRIEATKLREQRNQTVENWIKAFEEGLKTFKDKVYTPYRPGSIIHRGTVTQKVENEIKDIYRQKRWQIRKKLTDGLAAQKSKSDDMMTTTLRQLDIRDGDSEPVSVH